jgi:hypothetical protein
MRIREHGGFAHGLRPGTGAGLGCHACQAEAAAGTPPRITGSDEPGPVMTVHSPAAVNALRARFAELVRTAAALERLGEPFMAREISAKAVDLAGYRIMAPVECLLGNPGRHTFLAEFSAAGPVAGIGPGICGPCNARVTAAVLAAETAGSGKRGIDDQEAER